MTKHYSNIYNVDKETSEEVLKFLYDSKIVQIDYTASDMVLSSVNRGVDGRIFVIRGLEVITTSVTEDIHMAIEYIIKKKEVKGGESK